MVTLSIMLALDASLPLASCSECSGVCQEALSFASVPRCELCADRNTLDLAFCV